MRQISLSVVLVGSMIPSVVACLVRDAVDLVARGQTAAEIGLWVGLSLVVGGSAAWQSVVRSVSRRDCAGASAVGLISVAVS